MEGEPLRTNPAVAALLDLLRLMLPGTADNNQPGLPYRLVIEAWASPYFDWGGRATPDAEESIGIMAGDANALEAIARKGQVRLSTATASGAEPWQTLSLRQGKRKSGLSPRPC